MKFGVREICDVVFKAKSTMTVGDKTFFKDEPVIYFDSLKTSTLEGAATTVYAQGGKGNARLIAWEGERTLTFTMEDALISPIGFSILSGAGLTDGSKKALKVHTTETTTATVTTGDTTSVTVKLSEKAAEKTVAYVMILKNGEVNSEPYVVNIASETDSISIKSTDDVTAFVDGGAVLVDYYVTRAAGAQQIEITADKFGGNFYVEASTLFRDTNGVDMPAEFIIPNAKVQSNFTFTMASSGDPSTFTFTMDAFPDYTRFDNTKKVLAAIQIISETSTEKELSRPRTQSDDIYNENTGRIEAGPTNSANSTEDPDTF